MSFVQVREFCAAWQSDGSIMSSNMVQNNFPLGAYAQMSDIGCGYRAVPKVISVQCQVIVAGAFDLSSIASQAVIFLCLVVYRG